MKTWVMALVLALVLGSVSFLVAEEGAARREPPRKMVKVAGVYNNPTLKLTPDQREQVAAIQAQTQEKIKALMEEEQTQIDELLTDEQRATLAKITHKPARRGEAGEKAEKAEKSEKTEKAE